MLMSNPALSDLFDVVGLMATLSLILIKVMVKLNLAALEV